MSVGFHLLCELLEELSNAQATTRSTPSKRMKSDIRIVSAWFEKHDSIIPRHGPEAVAFLSSLFPERRPDRVYSLQEKRLEAIIGRAIGLGVSRIRELKTWRNSDGADLATTVERVMSATDSEARLGPSVTLQEIDEMLDRLAAASPFSSADLQDRIKARHSRPLQVDEVFSTIFRRLYSSEAKWMVRMLLKTYSPVLIPEKPTMHRFHFLLPDLLSFQNTFEAAVQLLQAPTIQRMPFHVAKDVGPLLKESAIHSLTPQVGVMVSQPAHEKARSIKHCCQMAHSRRMSVERKYDGEYCQIHIDLTKDVNSIKLFSKSGKDSTKDRIGLHAVLRDSLRLGSANCKIKKHCILEGEMLVWDDSNKRIVPFHKIRKHVQRSGRFLGTTRDSPVDLDEHLMVMFYDILLLDDIVCMKEPHDKRRQRLCSLVEPISGRAEIGSREMINFSSSRAPEFLKQAFARTITAGWEGLMLKGCNDPYYSFNTNCRQLKLKKDYIDGLGDSADLAIIGGRRDARDEQELRLGKLAWTSFYLGCLENKDDVRRFNAKPKFQVVDAVGRHSISKNDILQLNQWGYFQCVPFAFCRAELEVRLDQPQMRCPTEVFKRPFVVEVMGAGFDKPADVRYFTIRFPRVQKIHDDRTFKDTISFQELQDLALQSQKVATDGATQEEATWITKLHKHISKPGKPTSNATCTTSSTSVKAATTIESSPEYSSQQVMNSSRDLRTRRLSEDLGTGLLATKEPACRTLHKRKFSVLSISSEDVIQESEYSKDSSHKPSEIAPAHKRARQFSRTGSEAKTGQVKSHGPGPSMTLNDSETPLSVQQWSQNEDPVPQQARAEQPQNSSGVDCSSGLSPASFQQPFLLSYSLFSSELLLDSNVSFTFSMDVLLRCLRIHPGTEDQVESARPIFHVILVVGARPDYVSRQVQFVAETLMNRLKVTEVVGDRRIFIFSWKMLKLLQKSTDIYGIEWKDAFQTCLTYVYSQQDVGVWVMVSEWETAIAT